MKNKDLIEKLQQYSPDMEVAIYDWKKNFAEDSDAGSAAGIYPEIEIARVGPPEEDGAPDFVPWIAIGFSNEDYQADERPASIGLIRRCRVCGCTDNDCRLCIERTGKPCYWVEEDLCSACVPAKASSGILLPGKDF